MPFTLQILWWHGMHPFNYGAVSHVMIYVFGSEICFTYLGKYLPLINWLISLDIPKLDMQSPMTAMNMIFIFQALLSIDYHTNQNPKFCQRKMNKL